MPLDSNLLLHENSMIGLASGQLSVRFFPGCLPVLPWPHLSWVSPKGLPGACSSSTILIWLNTWFILSLRWGMAVCLNRACQPPAPIQSNLLARLALWRWRREAANLHLPSLSKKAPKSAYSLLLHVVSSGLNWLFIQPTTLVVNGLSVKCIHSLPILLTFGLCHEGPYLAAAAVGTDICPRERLKKERERES